MRIAGIAGANVEQPPSARSSPRSCPREEMNALAAAPAAPPSYPIALNLAGRRCVVVGGGAVAERKARGLLTAGALVVVIAPCLTAGLHALAVEDAILIHERPYTAGDLSSAFLAFAATD